MQTPTHEPAWQNAALPLQTLPQAPQFWASLSRARQIPSQTTVPAGQTHDPAMQA